MSATKKKKGADAAPKVDPDRIAAVRALLADRDAVLADGHHRFETACRYRSEAPDTPGVEAIMAFVVELTDEELCVVERDGEALAAIGYQVEPFGGRSVVIHAVPAPHPRFEAIPCFRELVADLARGRFGGWANRLERFAASFACRAAVKAGTPLSEPEMRALLLRLFETRLPPHDVHGRSTIVQLPRGELERRFGRH